MDLISDVDALLERAVACDFERAVYSNIDVVAA
jgi:hypothetical protein